MNCCSACRQPANAHPVSTTAIYCPTFIPRTFTVEIPAPQMLVYPSQPCASCVEKDFQLAEKDAEIARLKKALAESSAQVYRVRRALSTTDNHYDMASDVIGVLAPGSKLAVKKGCKCPVIDNGHGRGAYTDEKGIPQYWMSEGCPIHAPYVKLNSPEETPDP